MSPIGGFIQDFSLGGDASDGGPPPHPQGSDIHRMQGIVDRTQSVLYKAMDYAHCHLGGSGGTLPQKILRFKVLEDVIWCTLGLS